MSRENRNMIIGMLVLAGRNLSAAELVRLARPLGLGSSNVKSHLTRMVKEGDITREGPRRLSSYQPSAERRLVIEGIKGRLTERPPNTWNGAWLLMILRLPKDRTSRERWRQSLWFDGFRPISPEVYARPSWPVPWAEGRARYYAAHIPALCVRGELIGGAVESARLYDLEGLDSAALRLAAWIRKRAGCATSPRAAYVERIKVGGCMARFIGHDPRLPGALWAGRHGMVEVVNAFHDFEGRVARHAQRFIEKTLKQTAE